ncbi:MAG: universal stress protein [Pseudomonadota bacterium]
MKKFLVPVDGSTASLRALREAVRLARLVPGSSLHLVHVYEPAQLNGALAEHVSREDIESLQRRNAEVVLERAEAEVRDSGVPYSREALKGPIADTIASHAENLACDAIIMGRHGKRLADFFAGSVALRVLQASKLPVMLVP